MVKIAVQRAIVQAVAHDNVELGHIVDKIRVAGKHRTLQYIASTALLKAVALVVIGLNGHLQATVPGRNGNIACRTAAGDHASGDQHLA